MPICRLHLALAAAGALLLSRPALGQDLQVTSSSAPLSGSTAHAGSSCTVQSTIKNDAGAAVSTNFTLAYYYCSSANTTTCTALGSSQVSTDLAVGASTTVTSGTLTLPNNVRYGTRYIRFFVDSTSAVTESVETNNDRWDPISVTTRPDLYVSSATVPASGDTNGPGSSFTAKHVLRNAPSTSYFSSTVMLRYYDCPAKSSAGCTQLASSPCTNNYSAGEYHTHTSPTLTLPAGVTPGTRYLRLVVDADKQLTEGDETNNEHYAEITVVSGAPDAGPPVDGPLVTADGPPPTDGPSPTDGPPSADGQASDLAPSDALGAEGWYWPDGPPADVQVWEPSDVGGCGCALRLPGPADAGLPAALLLGLLLGQLLLRRQGR